MAQPTDLQTQLNTVQWTNGQRQITGSYVLGLFTLLLSIFAGIGAWDSNGNYTPNLSNVSGNCIGTATGSLNCAVSLAAAQFTTSFTGGTPEPLQKVLDRLTFPENWGASGDPASTTGSMTAGSFALSLPTPNDYQMGQGVVVDHAGPAATVGTPGGLTGSATSGTGSGAYTYEVAALDSSCGYSPVSAPIGISNYQTLGQPLTATVTGAAGNGATPNLVRLTVSSTAGMATGNTAYVSGLTGTVGGPIGTEEANFFFWTITVVDGTHIDLQGSTFTHPYVSGGQIIIYPLNTISWNAVSGAARYAIYNSAGTLLGVTSQTTWTDQGNPFQTTETCVPPAAPSIEGNDNLYTTVVLGAGTGSMSLANAASASVTNAGVSHNDTPAFNAAAASFSSHGGMLLLARGSRYPLRQGLNLPIGVGLSGNYASPGIFGSSFAPNADNNYAVMDALLVDPNYNGGIGINLNRGSSLSNLAVFPYGLVTPSSNQADFSGIGINAVSSDSVTSNVLEGGFNQCWNAPVATNVIHDRTTVRYLRADCTNTIYMANSFEQSIFEHFEMWPFLTVGYAAGNPSYSLLTRPGTGAIFDKEEDNTDVADGEDLGHFNGFAYPSYGNLKLGRFWSDNNAGVAYNFPGTNVTSADYLYSVTSGRAFVFSGHAVMSVSNLKARTSVADCITVTGGSQVQVANGWVDYCGHAGLSMGGTTDRYMGKLVTVNTFGGPIFLNAPGFLWKQLPDLTAEGFDGPGVDGQQPLPPGTPIFVGFNPAMDQCASAANTLLPANDNSVTCEVTGATSISFITQIWPGRSARMYFDNAITIAANGNVIPKAGNSSITTIAGEVLDFEGGSDGKVHEVGR